jgi:hypothetical protein
VGEALDAGKRRVVDVSAAGLAAVKAAEIAEASAAWMALAADAGEVVEEKGVAEGPDAVGVALGEAAEGVGVLRGATLAPVCRAPTGQAALHSKRGLGVRTVSVHLPAFRLQR